MGLSLWKRKHILRRKMDPVAYGGYVREDYQDILIMADIQTTDKSVSTGPDGDRSVQSLKMFCDFEVNTANRATGTRGDKVWHQGKWFECTSSRLSENTFLHHWTSTFVECLNQEEPPNVEEIMKGVPANEN